MSVLAVKNITKTFPGVKALDSVDLEVNSGEIHCLVGENGAGKSTLIKIITGIYEPDTGSILLEGNEKKGKDLHESGEVAYVPQEINVFEELSIAENLFAPFGDNTRFIYNRKRFYEKAEEILAELHLDVDPQEKVKNISVADKQLLQIGRALSRDNFKVLILDEPTASLAEEEVERLFSLLRELKDRGIAIVFITHILEEVLEMGDEITVLRNGFKVGHSEVSAIDEDWIVKKMTGKEIKFDKVYRPEISSGSVVMKVKNLSGPKFNNVSFELREGEILGIAGLVGAGRSELLQTIFGYLPVQSGSIEFAGQDWKFNNPNHAISQGLIYLPEERKSQGIMPDQSVRDNVGILHSDNISKLGVINNSESKKLTDNVIKEYDVKTASQRTKIKFLSGGNQQKILIGRSMKAKPKVLFFDEPTKGIDVNVKEEIYLLMKELAEEEQVGIVFVSSEMEEVLRCSNRILTLHEGEVIDVFTENEIDKETVLSSIIGRKQKETKAQEVAD